MKRKILIGCSVLVLLALVWIGAKNLNATAETDVSSGDATKEDTADSSGELKEDTENATEDVEEDDPGNRDSDSVDEEEETSNSGLLEAVSDAVESITSEEGVLYRIETSTGNNLGMVPIVNGSAVVLMDGSYASTYMGDYTPEETSALALKLEEETAQAMSSGKVDAWAFYRESQLRNFEFPEGITAIEKFAFARSGLNSIIIPEGVTRIGYGAFYHCDLLTDVTIPDSVTTIEENAFSHTPWLKNWMAGGEEGEEMSEASGSGDFLIVGDGILLAYRGSETEPELPAEVKSVVPGAIGE